MGKRSSSSHASAQSHFQGVTWDPRRSSWKARINYKGKEVYNGRYSQIEQAALAYDQAARYVNSTLTRDKTTAAASAGTKRQRSRSVNFPDRETDDPEGAARLQELFAAAAEAVAAEEAEAVEAAGAAAPDQAPGAASSARQSPQSSAAGFEPAAGFGPATGFGPAAGFEPVAVGAAASPGRDASRPLAAHTVGDPSALPPPAVGAWTAAGLPARQLSPAEGLAPHQPSEQLKQQLVLQPGVLLPSGQPWDSAAALMNEEEWDLLLCAFDLDAAPAAGASTTHSAEPTEPQDMQLLGLLHPAAQQQQQQQQQQQRDEGAAASAAALFQVEWGSTSGSQQNRQGSVTDTAALDATTLPCGSQGMHAAWQGCAAWQESAAAAGAAAASAGAWVSAAGCYALDPGASLEQSGVSGPAYEAAAVAGPLLQVADAPPAAVAVPPTWHAAAGSCAQGPWQQPSAPAGGAAAAAAAGAAGAAAVAAAATPRQGLFAGVRSVPEVLAVTSRALSCLQDLQSYVASKQPQQQQQQQQWASPVGTMSEWLSAAWFSEVLGAAGLPLLSQPATVAAAIAEARAARLAGGFVGPNRLVLLLLDRLLVLCAGALAGQGVVVQGGFVLRVLGVLRQGIAAVKGELLINPLAVIDWQQLLQAYCENWMLQCTSGNDMVTIGTVVTLLQGL